MEAGDGVPGSGLPLTPAPHGAYVILTPITGCFSALLVTSSRQHLLS